MSTGPNMQWVSPTMIRFTQDTVREHIYPDVPITPWRDCPPHTLPLNVIEHRTGDRLIKYVSYDNRRLYSAREVADNNPDFLVQAVVHRHDEGVSSSTSNQEKVILAWKFGDRLYRLSLRARTWFGSITMRAFKQSDTFPIVGSDDPPEVGFRWPTCSQYFVSEDELENAIPNKDWTTFIRNIPINEPIKVETWPNSNLFHERLDLQDFLFRFAIHFQAVDFRNGTSSFILRAATDVTDDFNRWNFGDMLTDVAENEDAIEFAWVNVQMKK